MSYIKKIELRNFKSFGLKSTAIFLDKGFTAITGPNGSGKTNIVDAILFGLGETSPRKLRVDNFSKLIFDGNDRSKGKARSAGVVIQFNNDDGRIPVNTKNVTISRNVFPNGQSDYRINGRKASRSRILEILSVAGIDPSGHNIVPQGTITRLAEISPVERRKIIEDLIGISLYNAEKAEAEEKLKEADTSINAAMGRVEEVQKRLDELEEERNTLIRYEFIQEDIRRLEAIICSYKMKELQKRIEEKTRSLEDTQREIEDLDKKRNELKEARLQAEQEWQKLSSEVIDEGRAKILNVQTEINDVESRIKELDAKINRNKEILQNLNLAKQERNNKIQDLERQIGESEGRIESLERYILSLSKDVANKQSMYDALSLKISEERSRFAEANKRTGEIENQLNKLYPNIVDKRDAANRKESMRQTLNRDKKNLMELSEKYDVSIKELKKLLDDLNNLKIEEEKRLEELKKTVERKLSEKKKLMDALSEAERVSELAKDSVVEFKSQRKLTNKIAGTEVSLKNIEEMARIGVIKGIYGRLRDLVRINGKYSRAIETVADGWLNALLVKDYDTAFICSETLKQLKLAKIKIIPLEGIESCVKIEAPKEESGVIGLVSDFIEADEMYRPALLFVFGDTVIVEDHVTALRLSRKGYRTVTVEGEVFNPKGGLEVGYHRSLIDFSAIIPSEEAIKSLEKVVNALRSHLSERKEYISSLDEEVEYTRLEISKVEQVIKSIEDEISRTEVRISKMQGSSKDLEAKIADIEKVLRDIETSKSSDEKGLQDLENKVRELQEELNVLRTKTDSMKIEEIESERTAILNELVKMKDELNDRQRELAIAKTNLEKILKASYNESKMEIEKIIQQIEDLEADIAKTIEEREKIEPNLRELEKNRAMLLNEVNEARDDAQKLAVKIRDLNEQLSNFEKVYEEKTKVLNDLKLKIQLEKMELNQQTQMLHELGFKDILDVSLEQVTDAESSLKMMRRELDEIGLVNQLASAQYEEQVGRYKELSVRLNELEMEKRAIIEFMEEIERKKKKAFMDAFNQINDSFSSYFRKLTGGGNAYMKLENPDDPFSGGLDIIVQFPNKPEILVSGASGGERSVASVAFIFAIQKLSPASFYLLDEIDAHLDPFYVAKLSELLVEESSRSQFLVITLKPETASHAQKVYGVYERNGVSNVVSATIK
ncbi:MAG: chromosome segregation protein SMC [Candidatus Bathyarchaeia archaeon]